MTELFVTHKIPAQKPIQGLSIKDQYNGFILNGKCLYDGKERWFWEVGRRDLDPKDWKFDRIRERDDEDEEYFSLYGIYDERPVKDDEWFDKDMKPIALFGHEEMIYPPHRGYTNIVDPEVKNVGVRFMCLQCAVVLGPTYTYNEHSRCNCPRTPYRGGGSVRWVGGERGARYDHPDDSFYIYSSFFIRLKEKGDDQ